MNVTHKVDSLSIQNTAQIHEKREETIRSFSMLLELSQPILAGVLGEKANTTINIFF